MSGLLAVPAIMPVTPSLSGTGHGVIAIRSNYTAFLKDNLAAIVAPGVDDDADAGYSVGSHWLYNGTWYKATDVTNGAAVWEGPGSYEPTIPAGTTGQYWRGDKSWQTLDKTAVGLNNVENTALSTWAGSTNLTLLGTIGQQLLVSYASPIVEVKGSTNQTSTVRLTSLVTGNDIKIGAVEFYGNTTGLAKIASINGYQGASAAASYIKLVTRTGAIDYDTLTLGPTAITAGLRVALGSTITHPTETAKTVSAGSVTIDWTVALRQKLAVSADVAISFTAPGGATNCQLKLNYSGAHTPSFSGGGLAIKWANGTEPTWTKVNGKTDIVTLWYDGAAWWGAAILNFTT